MSSIKIIPFTKGLWKIDLDNQRVSYQDKWLPKQSCYNLKKCWPGATIVLPTTLAYIALRRPELPVNQYNELIAHTDTGVWSIDELYLVNDPIESMAYPEYFHVALYERFVINKEGEVKNHLTGESLTVYKRVLGRIKKSTYNVVNLKNTISKTVTVGRYRALTLAFLKPPSNPRKLDVNHIDGNPLNDDLSNLEWSTRQENAQHAYATGLRDDNRHVLVKDINTGEVTEYFSLGEAARQCNSQPSVMWHRCNNEMRIYDGNKLFKFKDDPTPWPEVTKEFYDKQATPKVAAYNVSTKTVTLFKDAPAAEKETGVMAPTITARALGNNPNDYPIKGYLFYREHTLPEEFPQWTDLQLRYIRWCEDNGFQIKTGYLVTNLETKEEHLCNNAREIREVCGKWLKDNPQWREGKPVNGFIIESIF